MVQPELAFAAPAVPPSTCTLYHGDCLEVMPTLKQQCVHMCFADLPYGLMNAAWDVEIDLQVFWALLKRCADKFAPSIFMASHRFHIKLAVSNIKRYRYDLVWHKANSVSGSLNANKAPLRAHENILVFYEKCKTYNPQKSYGHKNYSQNRVSAFKRSVLYGDKKQKPTINDGSRYPTSVISVPLKEGKRRHPTQKPVALLEWLIATYTNPGDTVLDPVFGSNTTGVACARLGRNYIGVEKDAGYFSIGRERVDAERANLGLSPSEVVQ